VPDLPRRQVIREHNFERELTALIADARAADDFVEAAEFVLARDPLAGQALASPVWALPMPLVGSEQIVLYYAFDDSTVWLISIARV
jgi:hypothetical protein